MERMRHQMQSIERLKGAQQSYPLSVNIRLLRPCEIEYSSWSHIILRRIYFSFHSPISGIFYFTGARNDRELWVNFRIDSPSCRGNFYGYNFEKGETMEHKTPADKMPFERSGRAIMDRLRKTEGIKENKSHNP